MGKDTRTFARGIEEKGERAAGRERFRDSEGVELRANSPLRRGLFTLSPTDLCIIHLSLPAPLKLFGVALAKPLFYLINRYHT